MRLMEILQSLRQNFPMLNRNLIVFYSVFVTILIIIPVNSDLFSPKQQYYEDLYRGRKTAVSKAYSLIEHGYQQLREKMLQEAEHSFKEALSICQTHGLKECERDALDGWREVLEALGQHERGRLIRQLLSYAFTKKHWQQSIYWPALIGDVVG